jgi:hypothetical protein
MRKHCVVPTSLVLGWRALTGRGACSACHARSAPPPSSPNSAGWGRIRPEPPEEAITPGISSGVIRRRSIPGCGGRRQLTASWSVIDVLARVLFAALTLLGLVMV